MAAQCRSPRCTAERKGFRRELDSWRHRLIHCVGFESILEGLYGPGLRKDLSLFDDCEPEELVDWCVDDKCSLCNLRRDTNDYTPSGDSAQSTPTGELISQGQFNTEKTECQAENYLNALFQKKDLPQNCDPNIPLVAQELMKKMIRQFAIEYVSKSREIYEDSNGTIADDPLGCNGIKKKPDGLLLDEQDGPLDLTVSRIQEQTFQDGVLDLSIKRNSSAFQENSKTRNLRNGVMNGYFLRNMKKSRKLLKEKTALFKALPSWCLYHQQQLMGMLKFLKEEQESCSQKCHSAQSQSVKQEPRSPKTSLVSDQICSSQKSTKGIELNEKRRQMNLPYLTVCLKDLRFSWPNLNGGTVKLTLNKKEDLHLSDQLLYCINTRSKTKKQTVGSDYLNSYQATNQRELRSSSKKNVVPFSKSTMIKHGLQCSYTQPGCQLQLRSKCCQTNGDTLDGSYTTVIENMTFRESRYGNGSQTSLILNRKDTRKTSLDSSTTSCLNFGSLITHFKSESNSFDELLNQKENGSEINVQTGFHRNNEEMSMFDSSLSDYQAIDFARDLDNLSDTFPMEKNIFVKTSPNSINDEITVSVEEHAHEILVLKPCESTETESEVQEMITDLPHETLKIPSKNVKRIKNSQLCLPANLKHSAPQRIVNEKRRENKRRNDQDVQCENTIPSKRFSKNILGKCKLCDSSHGLCSIQDNYNLFCKCTIQKNSGMLKNFKADGVITRSTTEKNRNTHLKVLVERLEDSKLSANRTANCKDVCQSNLRSGKIKASSCILNVLQKTPNNVKQSISLNSKLVAQANYAGVETPESISETATSTTSSGTSYFSPIKLMFVSKVESEDGVKYTLSSEYIPVNKHKDAVELSDNVVKTRKTSHAYNLNSNKSRVCKNMALLSLPEYNSTTQNSLTKLPYCSDQNALKRKTLKRACQNINISPERQHKKCAQKSFAKAVRDTAISLNKTAKSIEHSAKFRKSRIAETYIVQNKGSSTQLRIKKVERFLRSSERNLNKPKSESSNFQRISQRLKLKKLSNISGMYKTNGCISQEGGKNLLIPFQKSTTKCTQKDVNDKAKQNSNQKTIVKQRLTRGSLQIRQLECSNPNTRSRKFLATSFSSLSSNFFIRSALCHKSKRLHLSKCSIYKRRLRSSKQQCKPPSVDAKCTGNIVKNCTANVDLQPNTVLKWWSASISKESLLEDFEKKYEQIANTWLGKNNGEKHNEAQALETLKFCRSDMRSPVQMLFQKKCDTGDLAAWFMQTTETQSLSIERKANARNPLQKINSKGPITKAKKCSINSCQSKKHFKKCAQSTSSETITELFKVSKTGTEKCKVGQNPNNLQSMTDQSQDVCVKFACAERPVDVTEICTLKASTTSKESAKEIALSANIDIRSAVCQGTAAIPSPITCIDSSVSSTKHKMLVQNKNKSEAKNIYMCCSSKQNIQDCKVFLTKLGDIESKMSCSYRASHSGNTIAMNKHKFKPEWTLKRSFTTRYCLRMNESLAKSPCTLTKISNSSDKKCNFGMCLRNSNGSAAPYDSHSKSQILERRNQLSKMTLYVEPNAKQSNPQIPNMKKLQSEWPNFQLGPIKSIGISSIRGLSSTGGTYSLTPIRIPL